MQVVIHMTFNTCFSPSKKGGLCTFEMKTFKPAELRGQYYAVSWLCYLHVSLIFSYNSSSPYQGIYNSYTLLTTQKRISCAFIASQVQVAIINNNGQPGNMSITASYYTRYTH